MTPTSDPSDATAAKRNTFRFLDLRAELRAEVYEYLALPAVRRLPLRAIDIYWNDYDTAILRACKFVAQEARPLFRHDHTLTFTYYANNAEALKGEMMISYSN
ncbi:hypothetical protein E8E11_009003 [Didymella keratinophila]|nr:hypothetical protein E8E11_009003 [Didymella keratinophila]